MAVEQADIRGQMQQAEQTEKVKQIFQADKVVRQDLGVVQDQEEVAAEPQHYS